METMFTITAIACLAIGAVAGFIAGKYHDEILKTGGE